jgi:hypothetical protein
VIGHKVLSQITYFRRIFTAPLIHCVWNCNYELVKSELHCPDITKASFRDNKPYFVRKFHSPIALRLVTRNLPENSRHISFREINSTD